MNRTLAIPLAFLLAAVLALPTVVAQKGDQKADQAEVQLKAAINKEVVEGNLRAAIDLYRRIAQTGNRPVAARALVRMGQCYEKLGEASAREARKAYEQVVREYGDQAALAAEARARLAALGQPAPTGRQALSVRRVWAGPDADAGASPSADGRYLAAIDRRTGHVVMRDLATGEMRRVTKVADVALLGPGSGCCAIFSPDEKQIVYSTVGPKRDVSDLRVVSVDGGDARTVLPSPGDGSIVIPRAWTPDGKHVLVFAFRPSEGPDFHVGLVSVADGSLRVLMSAGPDHASISPDGRYLAFDRLDRDSQRDIFLLDLQDGREVPLVQHPADDHAPIWQPDGKGIVFASDRTGSLGLWAMHVDDGKPIGPPRLVKSDIGSGIAPMGFSRSGALFYAITAEVRDIYVAKLDLAAWRVLEPPAPISQRMVGSSGSPRWSPDGKYLAYVSRRGAAMTGPATITIHSLDSDHQRDISVASTIYSLGWFPDGSALAVLGRDERQEPAILRVDVKSGSVTTLVRSGERVPAGQATVTPDGKSLVYLDWKPALPRPVIVRDLQTGQEREIMPSSIGAAVSPDGRLVAATVLDWASRSQAVVVVPIAGGEPREVWRSHGLGAIGGQPAWSPDGQRILFACRLQEARTFCSVSSAGGEPQGIPLPIENIYDFSIHPDGSRVAFAGGPSETEIWVIENFLPVAKATAAADKNKTEK